MANANERIAALTGAVNETNTRLDKVGGEINSAAEQIATELSSLREQIANGTVTEESLAGAEAAVATLQEKARGLDELHVDAENPEPTPVPEPTPAPEPDQPVTDGFGNPL